MYQEVTILRTSTQITEIRGDVLWQDEKALLDTMWRAMSDEGEVVELGVDPLPSWAEDIRSACQAHRIWAFRHTGNPNVYYAGIIDSLETTQQRTPRLVG